DAADLRVVGQVLDDLAGVVVVPLDPQAQGLDALEQQEGVEGADGRADVAQQLDPGLDDVGAGPERLPVLQAVVAGVGLGEAGVLAAGAEVEAAAVDDDTG